MYDILEYTLAPGVYQNGYRLKLFTLFRNSNCIV